MSGLQCIDVRLAVHVLYLQVSSLIIIV